jgi:hypothetical protein
MDEQMKAGGEGCRVPYHGAGPDLSGIAKKSSFCFSPIAERRRGFHL